MDSATGITSKPRSESENRGPKTFPDRGIAYRMWMMIERGIGRVCGRKEKGSRWIGACREPQEGTNSGTNRIAPQGICITGGVGACKIVAMSASSKRRLRFFITWDVFAQVSDTASNLSVLLPEGTDDIQFDTGFRGVPGARDPGRNRVSGDGL